MQIFSEKLLSLEGQPSHKRYASLNTPYIMYRVGVMWVFRYINYFSGLLAGVVKVNQTPLYLSQLVFSRLFVGDRVVMKIYERMRPVWTSGEMWVDLEQIAQQLIELFFVFSVCSKTPPAWEWFSNRGRMAKACPCVATFFSSVFGRTLSSVMGRRGGEDWPSPIPNNRHVTTGGNCSSSASSTRAP